MEEEQSYKLALEFLQRVNLSAQEVDVFLHVRSFLNQKMLECGDNINYKKQIKSDTKKNLTDKNS